MSVREYRNALQMAHDKFDKAVDVARTEYQDELRKANAEFIGDDEMVAESSIRKAVRDRD